MDPAAWHPKIRQLHAHWRSIHPAPDRLPGRQHLDPLSIPALLPNIWLVDVVRGPFRLRYRLVGTRIVDGLGADFTGQWFDEAHPDFGPAGRTYQDYLRVVEQKEVSWRRGKPIFMAYAEACVEIERILLPLARDGQTVDMIIAITIFFDAAGQEK